MANTKNKKSKKKNAVTGRPYTSNKLHLDIKNLEKDFYRCDLIFHDMENSVPSYEGRVFINNPDANLETPRALEHGYVGSYFIFGHGSCLGDMGHCDVHAKREKYDLIPNTLRPYDLSMTITNKLKEIAKDTNAFSITVVPNVVRPPAINQGEIDMENIVKFSKVEIVTYDIEE
jgi:hypothetical protein